ncbi:hypothetical protein MAM1_0147d06567 [Mucor ambiguus]|uniref:Uncharacterized protein n=1 Tax=Mucor ambiguus TaxID=91626 RepID=A0A0C9MUF9_9FUNG|nr:hypothetical protein MAM1_0147d06567 [Mucor ambiguus]
MTLIIRQIRALISEAPLRQKKPENKPSNATQERRKSLTVKISKEPPAIVYFERDKLEDSFECIFDPQVHHDDEKDHPDLFTEKCKKKDLKPWQKPPYCSQNSSSTLMSRFKSTFTKNSVNTTAATPIIMHQSNHSAEQVA